jgi:hypothetical protein
MSEHRRSLTGISWSGTPSFAWGIGAILGLFLSLGWFGFTAGEDAAAIQTAVAISCGLALLGSRTMAAIGGLALLLAATAFVWIGFRTPASIGWFVLATIHFVPGLLLGRAALSEGDRGELISNAGLVLATVAAACYLGLGLFGGRPLVVLLLGAMLAMGITGTIMGSRVARYLVGGVMIVVGLLAIAALTDESPKSVLDERYWPHAVLHLVSGLLLVGGTAAMRRRPPPATLKPLEEVFE